MIFSALVTIMAFGISPIVLMFFLPCVIIDAILVDFATQKYYRHKGCKK